MSMRRNAERMMGTTVLVAVLAAIGFGCARVVLAQQRVVEAPPPVRSPASPVRLAPSPVTWVQLGGGATARIFVVDGVRCVAVAGVQSTSGGGIGVSCDWPRR